MTPRLDPGAEATPVRTMTVYRRYYDLIATGAKTIEVRVAYPHNLKIQPGDLIRFICDNDATLTRVGRIASYATFDDLLDRGPVAAINPNASRAEPLQAMREIYPPEKEALGCLAIEIEKV